jgi:hypothetical protein
MAKHEYLTAAEEASYGRFEAQSPEQAVLERFFFLARHEQWNRIRR